MDETLIPVRPMFSAALPTALVSPAERGEAWRETFAAFAPKLLLYARQWAAAPADAEDIVQDAFVRCWRQRGDEAAREPGLLFAAVRTAALDLLRGDLRRRRREETATSGTDDVAWFQCPIEQRERADTLSAALARVPAEQREVVVLRIWGELSFPEIAKLLRIPEATAGSRFRYALESLRRLLPPTLSPP